MALVTLAKEIQTKKINKKTFNNLEKLMNVELLENAANSIVKLMKLILWFFQNNNNTI